MAFLDDIATYIAANSTAFTVSTNLFKNKLPPSPDTCTAIYEQSGTPPVWTMGSTAPLYEHPRLQVLTRSTSYQVARANAETVYQLLDRQIINQALSTGTPRYVQVMAAHTPADAGTDANERDVVTCNYDVWKERA